MNILYAVDPEAAGLLTQELRRQAGTIELVASENFVYPAILEAQGSVLTNKYAEGYPGARYHGGCEFIDSIETLAIERAKRLFGAGHANVQPHSGVNANLAALNALINPGDTILAMKLRHGGHLSHGSKISLTGKAYNGVFYSVDRESELIDYEEIEAMAEKHKPRVIIGGASAYSRIIDWARMRKIADSVGAWFMVDMSHIAGLVAGGVHPSPVPHAHIVTSTTTKTMRGARGGLILCTEDLAPAVDKSVFPGTQGGPILQAILAKAVTFKIAETEAFRRYAVQIVANARHLASLLGAEGLRIVSGGTDNHLMLLNVQPLKLTGQRAEELLHQAGIEVNKNMIPYDPQPPAVAGGIRIGTAAITSRGFDEADVSQLADALSGVLNTGGSSDSIEKARETVRSLVRRRPLYFDSFEQWEVV